VLSFMLGGRVMNEDVLIRFYVLHVALLPLFYMIGLYITFGTIRRVGLSAALEQTRGNVTTFRQHYIDLLIIALFLFAGMVTLATLAPFHFLGVADPYTTPAGARPPWYMLAPYAVFQRVPGPSWIPGGVMLAVALGLLLLPVWSRAGDSRFDEKRVRIAGAVAFGIWLALSVMGAFLDRR
jgi:quinol-cytochrome oxidoreductase complex cytochrome b subunit